MTYRAGLDQMGTIRHLSLGVGKALGRKVGDPRDLCDWSCPLDESIVYKRYWLPVLAALDLPHSRWHDLRHAVAVTSLAGEHYRDVSRGRSAVPCVSRRRRHESECRQAIPHRLGTREQPCRAAQYAAAGGQPSR